MSAPDPADAPAETSADPSGADGTAAGPPAAITSSVEEYLELVLGRIQPLQPIELGLADTLGLVLAEDIDAEDPLPGFATASTAGYAVSAESLSDASGNDPAVLDVLTDGLEVGDGAAVRLAGGARLPDGADAIVPESAAEVRDERVAVVRPIAPGENVRDVGRDLSAGERAVRAGRRVRPGDIAVLAALGRTRLRCHPQPRVVVLVAGDELIEAASSVGPGSVRDSNGPMLGALLRQAGSVTFRAGIVAEDRRSLVDAFDSNLGHADIFVAAGGAAGVVEQVLAMLGDVTATNVAMEPGSRQLVGTVRGVPVVGLPGHPAAVFVSFEVFVRPLLRRLQGRSDLHRPRISARLERDIETHLGVRTYLRVRLRRDDRGWLAILAGDQDPHDLASLAAADGLAEVPEDVSHVPAGAEIGVHLLIEP
jgi:molybdopterin molybdotransferase